MPVAERYSSSEACGCAEKSPEFPLPCAEARL
jgi:hypothetical protein